MIFYLSRAECLLRFILICLLIMILNLIKMGSSQITFQTVLHLMTIYQLLMYIFLILIFMGPCKLGNLALFEPCLLIAFCKNRNLLILLLHPKGKCYQVLNLYA
jgi:hypothetical protein